MSKGVFYLPVKFKKNFCHEPAGDQAKPLDSAVSLEELKEAVAYRKKVTQGEETSHFEMKTTNTTSPHTVSLYGSPEKTGQSSHPYRLAAACLGLLSALLLAATIVLCVLYMRAGENRPLPQNVGEGVAEQLRDNCSILIKDKDQLQNNDNTQTVDKDQLQKKYNTLTEENGQVQESLKKLTNEKEQLQKNYKILLEEKDLLQKNYNTLMESKDKILKNCSALVKDRNHLQSEFDALAKEKKQLLSDYTALTTENNLLQADYATLETEYLTLTDEKKGIEEERKTLQILLEEERNTFEKWNHTFMVVLQNKRNKEQLQRDFEAVLAKSAFLDQYCPLVSQKRVCKPCTRGWEQFYSKCYYFSTEKKTWMDSRSVCSKQGADLVIIKSEEEQEFLTKYTRDYNWIGLSDLDTEGTWLWVDKTPLQKGFWRSGQPDDHFWFDTRTQYPDADCVVTVPGENAWMDTHCYSYRKFICETDALLL